MSPETPLSLAADFPPATATQWRAAVDRVLTGKETGLTPEELTRRFDRQLVTTTYDGIAIQPLYTGEDEPADAQDPGVPGFWPYVRGATVEAGIRTGWDVRQPVELDRLARAGAGADLALGHLEHGATSVLIRPTADPAASGPAVDTDLLDAALDGVFLDLITVALDPSLGRAGAEALLSLWARHQVDADSARGVLGLDPLGQAAASGQPVDADFVAAATTIAATCVRDWPGARSWVVDAVPYHEAGASDVEELACATATGVAYLRLLVDAGLDVHQAFGQLEFRLVATADQFSTLAKLRAARRLWARVAEASGAAAAGGQRQHALTSRAMLTRYDPWVNLLRNTTAAFAAGTGGAEAVTVEAHDLLLDPSTGSDLGRRMARNTQLLLLEESHLARVIDPGGGSFYIESLTDAMARQAWTWFQEIEAAGGMANALESGLIRARIDATWAKRSGRLARRQDTLVGINDFPNIDDQAPPAPTGPATLPPAAGLPRHRYSEAFEALRASTDEHQRATGTRPAVVLVCLGRPADYTARVTFARGFFETAGLRTATIEANGSLDFDAFRQLISESGARLACVCSSDRVYAEQGAAALEDMAASELSRTYAATRPGGVGDALTAAGADALVYAGCDLLEILTDALRLVLA